MNYKLLPLLMTAPVIAGEKPVQLVGTLSTNGEDSRALISIGGEPVRTYCSAGEACQRSNCDCSVADAIIVRIGREFVLLRQGSNLRKLEIGQSIGSHSQPQGVMQSVTPPRPPAGHEQFWRTLLREMRMNQVNELLEKAEIQGGSAREHMDKLFAAMGLRPGDIVVRVQDRPFNPDAKPAELSALLRGQRQIFIETTREGRPMLFKIQVIE